MGRFTVVVKDGVREIEQVKTADEVAKLKTAPPVDELAELEAALDLEDAAIDGGDSKPADVPQTSGPDAYTRLADGLHGNSVEWAKQWINELTHPDQVTRVQELEKAHPSYEGGRNGVLKALDDRKAELTTKDANISTPSPSPAAGLPCESCDFIAGSQQGLDSHMDAHHSDEAQI